MPPSSWYRPRLSLTSTSLHCTFSGSPSETPKDGPECRSAFRPKSHSTAIDLCRLPTRIKFKSLMLAYWVTSGSQIKKNYRQIHLVVSASFYKLRTIAKVSFSSPKDCEEMVHAFISSRLDFCQAKLYSEINQTSLL